jgi:hypothetical protein
MFTNTKLKIIFKIANHSTETIKETPWEKTLSINFQIIPMAILLFEFCFSMFVLSIFSKSETTY